jgi:hypothetical protein
LKDFNLCIQREKKERDILDALVEVLLHQDEHGDKGGK